MNVCWKFGLFDPPCAGRFIRLRRPPIRLPFTFPVLLLAAIVFAAPVAAQTQETYTYDRTGRLTAVDYGNGARVRYTYDNNGNILSTAVDDLTSASAKRRHSARVHRVGAGAVDLLPAFSGSDRADLLSGPVPHAFALIRWDATAGLPGPAPGALAVPAPRPTRSALIGIDDGATISLRNLSDVAADLSLQLRDESGLALTRESVSLAPNATLARNFHRLGSLEISSSQDFVALGFRSPGNTLALAPVADLTGASNDSPRFVPLSGAEDFLLLLNPAASEAAGVLELPDARVPYDIPPKGVLRVAVPAFAEPAWLRIAPDPENPAPVMAGAVTPTTRARLYIPINARVRIANPHDTPVRVNGVDVPPHDQVTLSSTSDDLSGPDSFLAVTLDAGAIIPAADATRVAIAPIAFPPILCQACHTELILINTGSVPTQLLWQSEVYR